MNRRAGSGTLEDFQVPVKVKLSALWTAVMFCYVYGDYFGLYVPGQLQGMLAGKMVPLGPTTQGVLLGTSIMLAIPGVMVFLSLALKPAVSRWANLAMGTLYTLIMLATMPGAWTFYIFFGVVEVMLTTLVVWHAWRWPRQIPKFSPSGD
ncbi:hypothetical protein HDE78_000938 [Rhodanobacter sp. K2T2]|uniref:DUF6326 family protein n=1 Tax=Rhodanobacter sp. K2T2 TaxID=2723085 RepID=UPI0015C867A4|nr:DUF6326 family protein [Rhodanobacter sp. K2T2]NYE27992.1 hypothetical protein [Rhodanobacter sp. K2T2]